MDRYDPFSQMEQMFDQMRRSMLFDADVSVGRSMGDEMDRRMLGGGMDRPMGLPAGERNLATVEQGTDRSSRERTGMRETHVRMERTDEGFVAIADVPGFEHDELSVRIEGDRLVVEGHHEATEEDDEGVRSFSRRVHESVRVPETVDLERSSGSYRNGVLEIELPLLESADDDSVVIDIE